LTAADGARGSEAPHGVPSATRFLVGLALLATLAATTFAYGFFVTAGFSAKTLPDKRYTDQLASAFLHGQLHILQAPSKELLAQANPYDFKTSARLWKIWDASLYHGKYYLYWGPVPALFACAVKLVLGSDVVVGDRQIVRVFVTARLFVGAVILVLMLRWLWPNLSPWQLVPALALWGLVNPYPYVLGRPSVYEAAIESAQFFLLAGLLAAMIGVRRASERGGGLGLLGVAGVSWALAVGCRVSVLFAAAALVVVTVLAAHGHGSRSWRDLAVRFFVTGAPLAVVLFLLGAYNYARYGSFFDFGTAYQLTKQQFSPNPGFVLPNLHAYLLRRFTLSCEFPFVGAPFFATALTPAWVVPAAVRWIPQEPVVGLLVAIPGLVFAPVALIAAIGRSVRPHAMPGVSSANPSVLVWLIASCGVIWLLAAAPTLGVWTATMRYESDVTSAALLLAMAGFWIALSACESRGWRGRAHLLRALGSLLLVYSLAVALALGFQGGYYRAIKAHNPALHAKLLRAFSLCGGS